MKPSLVYAARAAVPLALLLISFGRSQAETKVPPTNAGPDALVTAALKSELDGQTDERRTLLDEALKRDPNFAPARWQSGFVRWDGEWLGVDEVSKRVADDKQLAAYRKMRDGMVDTADNHRALARWCHKNKLTNEERVHWAKVLEFERTDAEALTALGLQLHEGRWMTRQQIDEEKKLGLEQARATQRWRPQIMKWRNALDHGSAKEREQARKELRELTDPAAITPLEVALASNTTSAKSVELNQLLIETVGRIPDQEATLALLRRAILADSTEVRMAAIEQLKKRPMHSYVPLLIGAMPSELKSRWHVQVMPNGTVSYEHELTLEDQQGDVKLVMETSYSPGDSSGVLLAPGIANRDVRNAAAIERAAAATRQKQDWLRERIKFVLTHTTGFETVDNPELWIKQYNNYYGWHTPDEAKPTTTLDAEAFKYESYVAPPSTATQKQPTPPKSTQPTVPYTGPTYFPPGAKLPSGWHWEKPGSHAACFAAGTPVLTILGPKPIEQVKSGDRVLSQDPKTGELAFKPVQRTTLRTNSPLKKISLGSETIQATLGHPFWVVGEGWQTTKHLDAGMRLHGLQGPVLVDTIEDARTVEAYNLIVSDYHNYFVGNARVLVHDNSPLEDTALALPGLAAQAP